MALLLPSTTSILAFLIHSFTDTTLTPSEFMEKHWVWGDLFLISGGSIWTAAETETAAAKARQSDILVCCFHSFYFKGFVYYFFTSFEIFYLFCNIFFPTLLGCEWGHAFGLVGVLMIFPSSFYRNFLLLNVIRCEDIASNWSWWVGFFTASLKILMRFFWTIFELLRIFFLNVKFLMRWKQIILGNLFLIFF